MKIGSLCTGYGGLDMAVEAFFNAETVWTCEFDKYASKVIKERIAKPNYGDLKLTDWNQVEPIDIPKSQQLKILGNNLVPQQAFHALELLLNE